MNTPDSLADVAPDDLARTIARFRAGGAALDACRLLAQWAANRADLPADLAVIVIAARKAIM